MTDKDIKKIVKDRYQKIAIKEKGGCGCCSDNPYTDEQIAMQIGYADSDINEFSDANLGLGCGNPTALGEIKEGETVLDLGSGAGFDCFLAAKKVGSGGRVIGIDMTEEMIKKAEENAKKYGYSNVEFRLGEIEKLPIEDNSIDVIISNCVINLAPDKSKVFKEAYRVLKKEGRIYLSDIVLLEDLSVEQRQNDDLIAGCVGGALLRDTYLNIVKKTGFSVRILDEDKEISKTQYQGIPLESLKLEAIK